MQHHELLSHNFLWYCKHEFKKIGVFSIKNIDLLLQLQDNIAGEQKITI